MLDSVEQLRGMRGNYVTYEDLVMRCCDIADEIEHEVEERCVELPCDMDGEQVSIGDTVHDHEEGYDFRVDGFMLWGNTTEWWAFQDQAVQQKLENCSIVKPPTVEDVLREFFARYVTTKPKEEDDAIIAEYAAKLQLRGEHDG